MRSGLQKNFVENLNRYCSSKGSKDHFRLATLEEYKSLAAALEKPKEKEKRISTMTEVQIMEKLRNVVCDEDPKLLYSKIKKVGQGYGFSVLNFRSTQGANGAP